MGKKTSKIVIGIDQSYHDTGISISLDGKLKMAKNVYLESCKTNSDKREKLQQRLFDIFSSVNLLKSDYDAEVVVIIERIRLRSQGFLNIDYIKSIGALNALIVDCAHIFNYPVYSVDTRAWKSSIVGNSKGKENSYGIDPKKFPTILWCNKQGYSKYIKQYIGNSKKKLGVLEDDNGRYIYNDNIADSICISLYGFVPNNLLKEEH